MTPRRHKTPERILENNRRWREANRDKMKRYSVDWAQRNPAARMIISARHRARKRGLECTITRDDVVIPDRCPILGIELVCGTGVSGRPGGSPDSMSLDRIDPERGYVPGNVQVISHLANTMKSYASKEELVMFARWILETFDAS